MGETTRILPEQLKPGVAIRYQVAHGAAWVTRTGLIADGEPEWVEHRSVLLFPVIAAPGLDPEWVSVQNVLEVLDAA